MNRLTEHDEYGNADIIALSDVMPEIYAGLSYRETNALTDALNKLADYEDAEENGLLVRLPFCENSDLYVICEKRVREGRRKVIKKYVTEGKLDRFYFVNGNVSFDVVLEDKTGTYVSLTREDIGEVVFLTREEAEQALEAAKDE